MYVKIIATIIIAFCFSIHCFGQTNNKIKKAYIGISAGSTMFTGSEFTLGYIVPGYMNGLNSNTGETLSLNPGGVGLTINLIDAGYFFGKNWGVSLKWQGGAHVLQRSNEEFINTFGALMIGPVYTVPVSPKLNIDAKARVGRMYMGSEYEYNGNGILITAMTDYSKVGVEFGISLRYHFASKWSWLNNMEFQKQFVDRNLFQISRINLSTGIGFRF
ncbi:outer membrane beta-barrel protein [Algoriphagus sp. Y33]|uniref:outer membrane beta-barrel protein n=1 Tax=Algoriphagus sp. Y33 TaxID=2772483 RepID=UPI001781D11D|nr:outer membrane beta-barrel protein [Algoriphagus sp. Y33]